MAYEDVYAEVASASAMVGVVDEVSEQYATVLDQLLPPGRLWRWDAGTNARNLLRALGYVFDRIELRGIDLLKEFDPATMQELVPDWERVLGLPGDNPSPPTTLAGRRAAISAKLLGNEDPTPAFFEELAKAIGYDATVYHKFLGPFVAGSAVGDPVASGWQYYWEVVCKHGDNDELLEWVLRQLTPLHTTSKIFWLLNPVVREVDPPATLNAVAYGNGTFVAVGDLGAIRTSADYGVTWIQRTAAAGYTGTFNAVAYDAVNGLFCAVGTSSMIQTSPDGITWTYRAQGAPYSGTFNGVAHDGAGQWVIVGTGDGCQTSPDGVTWTDRNTVGVPTDWNDVAYGCGRWVIVGAMIGAPYYGRANNSTDGVNWNDGGLFGSQFEQFYVIRHDGVGQFLAAGGHGIVATSADGIKWRRRPSPIDAPGVNVDALAYVGDRWVMSDNAADYGVTRSVEGWFGNDWDWRFNPLPPSLINGAAYGEGVVVLVGDNGVVYTAEA